MGKRFFDTELFNKVWFRKLSPKHKNFWFYVLCNCDLAGIWEHDFEALEFFIGQKISEKEILENFGKQLLKVDAKRYIVKDFVEFQNGSTLNPKSPVHQKIINILERHRLYDRVSNRVDYTHIVVVEVIVEEEVEEIVIGEKKQIPSLEEFLNHCKSFLSDQFVSYEFSLTAKYETWVDAGWKDGHDNKIKNWKTKIKNTVPYLKKTEGQKQSKFAKANQDIQNSDPALEKLFKNG